MKNSGIKPRRRRAFADLPIRTKLLVIIMGVTAAALSISGLGLVFFDVISFRGYLQRDLSGLARITADNSTAALSFDDPSAATETLAALRARPHVVSACIYRADGAMFAKYSRAEAKVPCPQPEAAEHVRFGDREVTASLPILLTNRRIGTLVLLYDLDELYQRMKFYGATVLALTLASSLVALLLSSRLRRLIANPISQLASITSAVSETRDYGIRAEKVSRDELGVLVDGFNGMLAGIQSRDQELRSAREQLQLVTDTMAPAVTHCGRDLRYIWVSRRYADRLLTTPDEIAGRLIADVLGAECLATIRPYIERVLTGERVEYEAQLKYPAIGQRWIRAIYVPTHDPDGTISGWVADVSDITELKNAEAEVVRVNADLRKSNERLARSNEDLERFAFVASHDMQEPLRMVTAYAQLLVRTYPDQFEGEGKMFIHNIVDGAMRMRDLLADLLAYSEIDGDTEKPMDRVDLNAVIDTVLQNVKVAIEETSAAIVCEDLPTIAGYAGHYVQLFQNLVGNAIKYRSKEQPRIHISCERLGNEYRFAVADNGMGIELEYHAKIFGVFKRLHGKKIPGTGIGLAICQRVVERYGGRIWVESELGRGATFFFTLPGNTFESKGETQ